MVLKERGLFIGMLELTMIFHKKCLATTKVITDCWLSWEVADS